MGSTLVFYDWQRPLNRKNWLNLSRQFFSLLNSSPNFAEYGTGQKTARIVKPSSLDRVLLKEEIASCTLSHLLTPRLDVELSDVTCGYYESVGRESAAVFSYLSNSIDVDLFVGLVQRFSQVAGITYGHAFLRPVRLGPVMYAYDLVYGLDDSKPDDVDERKQMERWSEERLDMVAQNKLAPFRHLEGMQRDIYPLNVLTRPHIERIILGQHLRDWIGSDARRGRLWEVVNGVWVWIVPTSSLRSVQRSLANSGLLVSRGHDIPT